MDLGLRTKKAFTLIELLISIAIASMIGVVIYFSLVTALNVWIYSSDQLAIQKVLSESIDEVATGGVGKYGIRHNLEFLSCGNHRVEFVPNWIDDTHRAEDVNYIYALNRRIKPGTALPLGDFKAPEANDYRFITVIEVDSEDASTSQVRLPYAIPIGSALKFIYQPDPKANPDVIKTFWWDPEEGHIYSEYENRVDKLSKNPFGVKITDMELRYYDNNNEPVSDFDWVDNEDLNLITGVEIYMEAELGDNRLSLINFVNIPNAPLTSGFFTLTDKTKIPVPDSPAVHTLLLKNFTGVSNGDELQIDLKPDTGKSWRIKIVFKRSGLAKPKIESYTIEYPIGRVVYTEHPSMGLDAGLNLLTIGPNGLYDYDDDEDIEDFVLLEGDVVLEVDKMDIEGVGLFVRP